MDSPGRALRLTPLWIIAIILAVAVLHWMQVLAVPIATYLFLMALIRPTHAAVERRTAASTALAPRC
jgi:AI-2 transport protein TqsA